MKNYYIYSSMFNGTLSLLFEKRALHFHCLPTKPLMRSSLTPGKSPSLFSAGPGPCSRLGCRGVCASLRASGCCAPWLPRCPAVPTSIALLRADSQHSSNHLQLLAHPALGNQGFRPTSLPVAYKLPASKTI